MISACTNLQTYGMQALHVTGIRTTVPFYYPISSTDCVSGYLDFPVRILVQEEPLKSLEEGSQPSFESVARQVSSNVKCPEKLPNR